MTAPETMSLLVLGDSHASVFQNEAARVAFPGWKFDVRSVGGATVSGLPNPNNVSQSMPVFREALATTSAHAAIIMLGEVDTGFVIWHRAQRYSTSVDEMLARALQNYSAFLDEVASTLPPICISAPLPTIGDGLNWGHVANARREVRASQADRTSLTMQFNASTARFCEQRGYEYVMLDEASIGPNGVVRSELLNPDPADHHYDASAYVGLLAPRLRECLYQRERRFAKM